MYDIACKFDQYLQARMDVSAHERLTFAVSIFHAFGHGFGCQTLFSPRRVLGAGLTDGEACERIWAKLRYCLYLTCIHHKGILYPLCGVVLPAPGDSSPRPACSRLVRGSACRCQMHFLDFFTMLNLWLMTIGMSCRAV